MENWLRRNDTANEELLGGRKMTVKLVMDQTMGVSQVSVLESGTVEHL